MKSENFIAVLPFVDRVLLFACVCLNSL